MVYVKVAGGLGRSPRLILGFVCNEIKGRTTAWDVFSNFEVVFVSIEKGIVVVRNIRKKYVDQEYGNRNGTAVALRMLASHAISWFFENYTSGYEFEGFQAISQNMPTQYMNLHKFSVKVHFSQWFVLKLGAG
jgi:hypothetical protein